VDVVDAMVGAALKLDEDPLGRRGVEDGGGKEIPDEGEGTQGTWRTKRTKCRWTLGGYTLLTIITLIIGSCLQ
jgi:hypothetical protein